MADVNIIVAVGQITDVEKGFPIGKGGKMPWHESDDLKFFKDTTSGHVVIMGRNTMASLENPLPNRTNIVVSKTLNNKDGFMVVPTLEDAIFTARGITNEDIFIIGGAQIYKYALDNDLVDNIYITYTKNNVPDADAFFPTFDITNHMLGAKSEFWLPEESFKLNDELYAYRFLKLRGVNNNTDRQYISLLEDIIEHGEEKDTRAGKTLSVFGRQLRFNLKEGLPILTTKKVFSKGCIHELLWFLSGNTNIKYLVDNDVHIWDDDAYRYYLELIKKHNEVRLKQTRMGWETYMRGEIIPVSKDVFMERVKQGYKQWVIVDEYAFLMSYTPNIWEYEYQYGDLNRVYGAQWTNWGGHNQIQEVIDTLKKNPDDRRMIVSAWNVDEIPDMALPPCHYSCQFYTKKMTLEERIKWAENNNLQVNENIELLDEFNVPTRKLSCMWQQRSVDCGLGLPFNILSYAILTHMVAQCVNMDVDELIFNGGDCHIYENQINAINEQIKRNAYKYALPKLNLNKEITNIFDFKYNDIKIEGYKSYPVIKMPLSVGL